MSSYKGKIFVSGLAIVPPAVFGVIHTVSPATWLGIPRTFILLAGLLWAWLVYRITLPYFFSPLRHLPAVPAADESWLFGVAGAINREPRGHKIGEWVDAIPNAGLIYGRGLLHGFPALLLTSPEGLQEALVTKSYDFEKVRADRTVLEKFLGRGLIIAEGAEHKQQRKHLQPSFSGRQINALVPLFWAKAREFTQILSEQLSVVAGAEEGRGGSPRRTGAVDLDKPASRVTLDIIGLACLGRDFDALHNSHDRIVEQYEKILAPDSSSADIVQMLPLIFLPVGIARHVPLLRRMREAADASYWLRIYCRELMEAKRRDPELNSAKHVDIISTLIRTGQFSNDQLVDQVMTFLAAGHETTSNALCWTMYLLATHPSIQTRLRAELRTHFGPSAPATVTPADLDALPYLSAIISEQLRLWPVVPITGREASRDTTLLGQFVPKGTIVLMSPWAINRSKTHWGPTAAEFRPERWLADAGDAEGPAREIPFAGQSPYTNITFLHGPRSCIGQAFSRAELKCLIVAMILWFEVEMANPGEKVETAGLITIRPKNGLRLRLTEV